MDSPVRDRQTRRSPTTSTDRQGVDSGVDLTAGFHTYGINWVPCQSITWYFDGKQMAQVTSAHVPIPNEPDAVASRGTGSFGHRGTSFPSPCGAGLWCAAKIAARSRRYDRSLVATQQALVRPRQPPSSALSRCRQWPTGQHIAASRRPPSARC
ncbi:family 16 glycosylhydrolase [Mesorhizobium sp.]|uniref:family 16 glycosylhydrolase n=1 Tax=Mesorhizobium sp. TaxID=1871066 RepID=UPI000FE550CE|nr:MAG: glycosyl hydrolase family protein [Mesorhizobium sp.]